MSRTESTMLALGTPAPAFALPDVVSGHTITLDTFADKHGLLVMFICRHCPYVRHVQIELGRLGRNYAGQSLGIVAISSNDSIAYPDDAPASLAEMAAEQGFLFPFCFDESQDVARSFQAVCTPDFYLFDANRHLVYRGRLDDSRPKTDTPVTGRDLREAIEALLHNREISPTRQPALAATSSGAESPLTSTRSLSS